MGIFFCQVLKIKLLNQDKPSKILGNQKLRGDLIFISIEEFIILNNIISIEEYFFYFKIFCYIYLN